MGENLTYGKTETRPIFGADFSRVPFFPSVFSSFSSVYSDLAYLVYPLNTISDALNLIIKH